MIKWNDECLTILETITDEIRRVSEGKRPLPLKNSNKCIRCSINSVCLPDETAIMTSSDQKGSARAVVPARYDRSLVYVSGYDKKISLNGECLVISSFSGERREIPIKDVLSVSIMGTAQI